VAHLDSFVSGSGGKERSSEGPDLVVVAGCLVDGRVGRLGRPRDALDHVVVVPHLHFALARLNQPHPDCLVVGAGGDHRAVSTAADHSNPLPVTGERLYTVSESTTIY